MMKLSRRRAFLAARAVLLFGILLRGTGWAQCAGSTFPSDSSFAPTTGQAAAHLTPIDYVTPDPAQDANGVQYNITRVVGSGLVNGTDLDANGFLTNYDADVVNGVIGATASITISSRDPVIGSPTAFPPQFAVRSLQVNVNGHLTTPTFSQLDLLNPAQMCLQFSSRYLKFPARVLTSPSSNGTPPAPVTNRIDFVFGMLSTDCAQSGNQCLNVYSNWFVTINVGNLTIQAMAPIVMVHGWGTTGPWYWGDSPSNPPGGTTCGKDPKGSTKTRDGGFGFVGPFVSGGYPFDCSINITPSFSDQQGANSLKSALLRCQTGIPDVVFKCPDNSTALGVLASFGAKHVHLITHSKGGLWARNMISDVDASALSGSHNELFGIYSMTTLSAPNLGSALADKLIATRKSPLLDAVMTIVGDPTYLLSLKVNSAGAEDLTIPTATKNTMEWKTPSQFTVDFTQNNAKYYALGANADLNGNMKIDGSANPCPSNGRSCTPASQPAEGYPAPKGINFIQDNRYNTLATTGQANIHGVAPLSIVDFDPTTSFQLNDTAVTVSSALGAPGFSQPTQAQSCNGLPCLGANHDTIGSSMNWNPVAQQVIQLIKSAQPVTKP